MERDLLISQIPHFNLAVYMCYSLIETSRKSGYIERLWFLHPFVLKEREMAQPVSTKAQPTKIATMSTDYARPLPPMPSFLLVKPIFKTDGANMRPKLHDEYTLPQW